jgi:hypothetical protein
MLPDSGGILASRDDGNHGEHARTGVGAEDGESKVGANPAGGATSLPWSWASLPGLNYLPGTTRIVVAMGDAGNWRGRMYFVTSTRRAEVPR